ncbi:hypothetical protein ACHAWF_001713 [Thalassiosira exigua]
MILIAPLLKLLSFLLSCCGSASFSWLSRRISLSLTSPQPAPPPTLLKAETTPRGEPYNLHSSNKWILLVEDEDDLRSAIGKFLAKEGGYNVTGVRDARSAILLCRGIVSPNLNSRRSRFQFNPNFNLSTSYEGPDCLVLDVRLGSTMNGLELLKLIRSDPLLEALPVVLLTAKGNVDDRIQGYKAGADAYLAKPFDPEELLSIISGLLVTAESIAGEAGGRVSYRELKRELMETKSLLRELDGSPLNLQIEDFSGKVTVDSLHRNLLEMKGKIKDNAKQIHEDNGVDNLSTFSEQSKRKLFGQFDMLSVLTPEETAIIILVTKGLTNNDIAMELKCSASKVEKHVAAMFRKAGVKNRLDLAVWWEKYSKEKADESSVSELESSSSLLAEERDLITFLSKGMTIDEISSATKATREEVSECLNYLFKKANVKNRTGLLRWWKDRQGEKY